MRHCTIRYLTSLLGLAVLMVCGSAPAQAQGGATITGRVTDQATGQPIVGARVTLEGTVRSTTTGDDGRFTLSNVAVGPIQVTAAAIGHKTLASKVTTLAGQSTTVDFALPAAVIELNSIVVTATGEQRQREVANAVTTLDVAQTVKEAPVSNVSELLSARAPSVRIESSSGTVGGGSRVRIRGANSITLNNEPIIVVDGVRIDNDKYNNSYSLGVGGQLPSSLDQIDPRDIETIEVVKGPAAATLYGTDAVNGVIQITTKRGRPGPAKWEFWTEQGAATDNNDYQPNYNGYFTPSGGTSTGGCTLPDVAAGNCTQDSTASFNVLKDARTTPITNGYVSEYGGTVSGGSETARYFFSTNYNHELGTMRLPTATEDSLQALRGPLPDNLVRPNTLDRWNLRGNLTTQLDPNLRLDAFASYVDLHLRLPQNDNNVLGILPSGLFGTASMSDNGGWGFYRPEEVFAINSSQHVSRFIGGATANWQPLSWLTVLGTGGLDLSDRFDSNLFPTGEVNFGTNIDGTRNSNRINVYQYTGNANAAADVPLSDWLRSRTTVGAQFTRNRFESTTAFGNKLPSGTGSLAGAVVTTSGEQTTETTTIGTFAEEQFAINDRIFLTGAVRIDDNSDFGAQFNGAVYPKASASWVISEEPFFPTGSFLSQLRLRGAWGVSGNQPGVNTATTYYTPVAVADLNSDVVGVTPGGVGDPSLKPERSNEVEVGFDAELLNSRVGAEFTYFYKKTDDALVNRTLAPSLGTVATQTQNLGSMRNEGIEASISAQLVRTSGVDWHLTVSGATLNNKLLALGPGVEPIVFDIQQHRPGYPAGGYWQRPILGYSDDNGDGIITTNEVQLGDTAEYLGTPLPKRELSVHTGLTLGNLVRVSGLLDYRGGHVRDNGTEWFRCSQIQVCAEDFVAGTDMFRQARAVVAAAQLTRAGYVEDASFWRMREVAATFMAPASWARSLRVDALSLTLTCRNLFTITNWTGLDVESQFNQTSNFGNQEFLTQPALRTWAARLNLSF
jgi:TonB-dependent starch-binding outer membrane protein SusC